jgi:hypothetical protein
MNLLDLARSALADRPVEIGVVHDTPAAVTVQDPATEARRAKALAMLEADPKLQLVVVVEDPDADPVIVMVARRSYTGEIEIPLPFYDPLVLMELLDRQSDEQ